MAERGIFTPVFEEAESAIRDRMLAHPDLAKWRREPGDFMYDAAVGAAPAEVQQLQIGLDTTLKNGIPQYAEDEWLDNHLAAVGITRLPATPNKRTLRIAADAGVNLAAGQELSALVLDAEGNPLRYSLDLAATFAAAGSLDVAVTCLTVGAIGNLATGSQFILQPAVLGVRSIVDLGTTVQGTDTESDAAAWKRYDFKINNPDTGGNKNDLKRWAEEVAGVGAARVIRNWNGNGTTKIVVTAADYTPASAQLVADVQAYMDPGSTGLGDGKAPAGNQVTAVAAQALNIAITATVDYYAGVDPATVKAAFTQAVKDYLAGIIYTDIPVSIAKIGSLLIGTYGVANYSALTLNGGTVDVPVGTEQSAVVGVVTI